MPDVLQGLYNKVVAVASGRQDPSIEVRGIEERYDTTKEPMVYEQRVGLEGR